MTDTDDYTNRVHIDAHPDRVFEILTSAAEFAGWWSPATGSAAEGGELRITFDGIEGPLVLAVKATTRPAMVTWDVEACDFLPDWVGTRPAFTLSEGEPATGECDLPFQHDGLSPRLECYNRSMRKNVSSTGSDSQVSSIPSGWTSPLASAEVGS